MVFLPYIPPERLRDVVRAADEAGLEELWLWEDCFQDGGVATMAAALAWSERVRVGMGLFPAPLRNVAMTAMELATLHRLFPGRVRPGVGHGVLDWMGQVGARAESPVTLLREYVTALRALLRGERVSADGRYVKLTDVALGWPPPANPELMIGAGGPRTLRLAGELGDGTIITGGTTRDQVRRARRLVDEGRAAAGRTDDHRLIVYVHAAIGPTAAERLEAERVRWGYDSIKDIALTGDARAVADEVREWVAAGADTVVFQPTQDDPDLEGLIRFVAQEVRPLVR